VGKRSYRELLRASTNGGPRVNLIDYDSSATFGLTEKKADKKVAKITPRLFDLQERLYAERKRALLIVLQGMDTSGKDGLIKHVIAGLNPQGTSIHAFKEPTPEEKRHHFLWRFRRVLPEPGTIGIFNRSYYEDVLVVRVKQLASPTTIERRYDEINKFEKELVDSGIALVKLCLHISYDEQRRRLSDRLTDPDKNWKFNVADIQERPYWDDYTSAYDIALTRCEAAAPWYVIPADNKWFRDLAASRILLETLVEMNPQYPRPKLPVKALLKRLEPAHPG
jgi:PPK2 family polyphosphate:nucleotide phosphotransferase